MKIALIGATGFIGAQLLTEALNRGHQVTAIVRHANKLPQNPNLVASQVDVFDTDALAEQLAGQDAVISAYNPGWSNPNIQQEHIEGSRAIVQATKQSGVKRLLVVGGAGSLEVAPGVQVLDNPDFPEQFRPGAEGTRQALHELREEQDLQWTVLSPSAVIAPGQRTGHFRLGTDQLLVDANGDSKISVEDYAVALLDEAENPKHIRQRFTVGY